jgi:hypothetical protein
MAAAPSEIGEQSVASGSAALDYDLIERDGFFIWA